MNIPDLFAPPKAPLDIAGNPSAGAGASRAGFPWLFVLRYVVGALVLASGLFSLHALWQSWATLVDRAFIDPNLSPGRALPVLVLNVASGAAILAKRKLSLALTLLWIIGFLYLAVGNGALAKLGANIFLNVAVLLGLFAFQCLLLARGLLR